MEFHQQHSNSDGVSQRINSPRFAGSVTRRAHSFKRKNSNNSNNSSGSNSHCTQHEIDVQINSPRSENPNNPALHDGLVSPPGRKQTHNQNQRVLAGVAPLFGKNCNLLKKPFGSIIVDLVLRQRRRLRRWMFFLFCGFSLFLGVLKICANGWFGSSVEPAGPYVAHFWIKEHTKHLRAQNLEEADCSFQ